MIETKQFSTNSNMTSGTATTFSTANNDFTIALYQALFPGTSSKNLIFSPFSLHTVLGMVGVGARNKTRTEIFSGLKLNEKDDAATGKTYHSVISGIQGAGSPETFILLTANRIYGQTGFELNQKFVAGLKEKFLTQFEQLDLSTSEKCGVAAGRINQWVESTTNNKIKNLISPDALGPMTRVILVNGIYFKGLWEEKFNSQKTRKGRFRLNNTQNVEVDMMHLVSKLAFADLQDLNAEALALPYKGGRLSMIIILPKTVDGLGRLQSSIGSILQGGKSLIRERLSKRDDVDISLPKFKIEANIGNLPEVLKSLGMKSMFSPSDADFGSIPDNATTRLYVSNVIQKAFLEVNEEGSEAAAATGMMIMGRSMPITIPFLVDRPFHFQIVDHSSSDLVLFAGHCNDPTKS